MRYQAIAWDIDGTLVDSEPLHHRALVAGSKIFGVNLSELPDRAFCGIHMKDVWVLLRSRMPVDLDANHWLASINRYYIDHRSELVPISGAIETVRALAQSGIRQVCVSNSARTIVDANLESLGILDCLAFSISLDDVLAGKPDPGPYLQACRRLGTAPHATIAVEDSITGVKAARDAGLFVIGYSPIGAPIGEVDILTNELLDVSEAFGLVKKG